MSDIVILSILKFLALGVGFASTVWGMTRETTFDDDTGRKRLTPAGHLAVALALGSFLVAVGSYGFETLAKQADDAEHAAQIFRQEAREQRRDEQARRANAERRIREVEARAAAAAQRVLTITLANEQRIVTLTAENEQRLRDLALARNVNLRAQENLGRTGAALAQLERVLQPIGQIEMEVLWEVPIGSNHPRLVEFVARTAADPELPDRTAGITYKAWFNGALVVLGVGPDSPLYPALAGERALWYLASGTVNVTFVAPGGPSASQLVPSGNEHSGDDPIERLGDIRFRMRLNREPIEYHVDNNSIRILMTHVNETTIQRSGNIVSVPDLEQAMLVIGSDSPYLRLYFGGEEEVLMRRAMRPLSIRVRAAGRSYSFAGDDIRQAQRDGHLPIYYVSPVGRRHGPPADPGTGSVRRRLSPPHRP